MLVKAMLLTIVLVLGAVACAHDTEESMPVKDEWTVLTYNVWHGLNPRGIRNFEEFESPETRERRYQQFLVQARRLDPDIVFLQEVNPAPAYTRRAARDLGMDGEAFLVNTGIKIGPWGPPFNFYSGNAILAKKGLHLHRVGNHQLSGQFQLTSRLLCLQTSEVRYAGAATVRLGGVEALLIVVHLHHGPEVTTEIREAIENLARTGAIPATRPTEIFAEIEQSSWRRQKELNAAIDWVSDRGYAGAPTILAGDFNAAPDAPEMRWLKTSQRFRSVTKDDGPDLLMTWDHVHNRNTDTLKGFEPVNHFEEPVMSVLQPILEGETRRLDYIMVRGWDAAVSESGLFGTEPTAEGLMASDHFGVFARLRHP